MRTSRRIGAGLALAIVFACSLARAQDDARTLHIHGSLDLSLHGDSKGLDRNQFDWDTSPFSSYRARLFIDGEASPGVQVFAEATLNEGAARAQGAYVLLTPWQDRDLHLMAGKIPWPIGTWAPRAYSNRNPLIGTPLMYQYRTSLRWDDVPPSVDALLASAATGFPGPDYGSGVGSLGMPIVDDFDWDFGVVANGSVRPFEFAIGETQSAPSWPSPGSDQNRGVAVMGRLGFAPVPEIRIGASAARGAYLPQWLMYALPAGSDERDYPQTLVMGDLELARDRFELSAEGFGTAWKTPYVGTLRSHGGYAEARIGLVAASWFALRYDLMRFSNVAGTTETRPWDDDLDRVETGFGYRVSRAAIAKVTWQHDRLHAPGGVRTSELVATQFSINF